VLTIAAIAKSSRSEMRGTADSTLGGSRRPVGSDQIDSESEWEAILSSTQFEVQKAQIDRAAVHQARMADDAAFLQAGKVKMTSLLQSYFGPHLRGPEWRH
jgi:hypothetical protein